MLRKLGVFLFVVLLIGCLDKAPLPHKNEHPPGGLMLVDAGVDATP